MEGLTLVITGVLESMERDETKSLIEKYGGKVTTSISKKTDYILVGRDAGVSKIAKVMRGIYLMVFKWTHSRLFTEKCTLFLKCLKKRFGDELESERAVPSHRHNNSDLSIWTQRPPLPRGNTFMTILIEYQYDYSQDNW